MVYLSISEYKTELLAVVVVTQSTRGCHVSKHAQTKRRFFRACCCCACRRGPFPIFYKFIYFLVNRVGDAPMFFRLPHGPLRENSIEPLGVGIDPPPGSSGIPPDQGKVTGLLAKGRVSCLSQALLGPVAVLAGVPFDTRPIPLDEVQLRVVFWEEDAVVAPRNDELLDGVLLILEVWLLREIRSG